MGVNGVNGSNAVPKARVRTYFVIFVFPDEVIRGICNRCLPMTYHT
jgi:hypothetical protein